MNTKMKKQKSVSSKVIMTLGFIVLSAIGVVAQNSGEFPVPLSDPNKRGKLKAHLNTGTIIVKGTARKDVLVKYSSPEMEDKQAREHKEDLKRIISGPHN